MFRRHVLAVSAIPALPALSALSVLGQLLASPAAQAQVAAQLAGYPAKPIKLVIPFPPGGTSDTLGRVFANELGNRLKQPVIVLNAPGAGGMIAAQQVTSAPADGYTLFLPNASTLTIAPQLLRRKAPEPWTQFVPIAPIFGFVNVLVVRPDLPVNNLRELVQYARANPDKLSFASPGVGTTPHLLGESLKREADIRMVHVAYKGATPALTDLISGQVDVMFESAGTLQPYVTAAKLKVIAIAGDKHLPLLSTVKTVAEQGMPGLALQSWTGVVAAVGTDRAIVEFLSKEIAAAMATPAVRESLLSRSMEPMKLSPAEFDRLIRQEYERWTPVIRSQNITAD